MENIFDQFDQPAAAAPPTPGNIFDQFDAPKAAAPPTPLPRPDQPIAEDRATRARPTDIDPSLAPPPADPLTALQQAQVTGQPAPQPSGPVAAGARPEVSAGEALSDVGQAAAALPGQIGRAVSPAAGAVIGAAGSPALGRIVEAAKGGLGLDQPIAGTGDDLMNDLEDLDRSTGQGTLAHRALYPVLLVKSIGSAGLDIISRAWNAVAAGAGQSGKEALGAIYQNWPKIKNNGYVGTPEQLNEEIQNGLNWWIVQHQMASGADPAMHGARIQREAMAEPPPKPPKPPKPASPDQQLRIDADKKLQDALAGGDPKEIDAAVERVKSLLPTPPDEKPPPGASPAPPATPPKSVEEDFEPERPAEKEPIGGTPETPAPKPAEKPVTAAAPAPKITLEKIDRQIKVAQEDASYAETSDGVKSARRSMRELKELRQAIMDNRPLSRAQDVLLRSVSAVRDVSPVDGQVLAPVSSADGKARRSSEVGSDTGAPSVVQREKPVSQSEVSGLPKLRRARNRSTSGVGSELPSVPGGSRSPPIEEVQPREVGQRQGVRAGERLLGDEESAGSKQAAEQVSGIRGPAPNRGGVVGETKSSKVGDPSSAVPKLTDGQSARPNQSGAVAGSERKAATRRLATEITDVPGKDPLSRGVGARNRNLAKHDQGEDQGGATDRPSAVTGGPSSKISAKEVHDDPRKLASARETFVEALRGATPKADTDRSPTGKPVTTDTRVDTKRAQSEVGSFVRGTPLDGDKELSDRAVAHYATTGDARAAVEKAATDLASETLHPDDKKAIEATSPGFFDTEVKGAQTKAEPETKRIAASEPAAPGAKPVSGKRGRTKGRAEESLREPAASEVQSSGGRPGGGLPEGATQPVKAVEDQAKPAKVPVSEPKPLSRREKKQALNRSLNALGLKDSHIKGIDNESRVREALSDPAVAEHLEKPWTLNQDTEMPYIAGYTEPHKDILIDHRFDSIVGPALKNSDELPKHKQGTINHERTEKALIDARDYNYQGSHIIATGVEQATVKALKLDWKEHQDVILGGGPKFLEVDPARVHPSIDTTPYRDTDGGMARLKGETPPGGEKATALAEGAGGLPESRLPVRGSGEPVPGGQVLRGSPDAGVGAKPLPEQPTEPVPKNPLAAKRQKRNELDEAGAEGKPQTVIPGAGKAGQGDLAQRASDRPLKPRAPQKPSDIGLFSDDANQRDMFASARPAIAEHPAFTPRVDTATLHEIENEIQSMASRIVGRRVPVRFRSAIPTTEIDTGAVGEAYGLTELHPTIGGYYQTGSLPGEGVVHLALDDPRFDPRSTAAHELMHHINRWLFNDVERAIIEDDIRRGDQSRLRQYASRPYGGDVGRLSGDELLSFAYEGYRQARSAKLEEPGAGLHIAVRRAFGRLYDFLGQVKNRLFRRGVKSVDDIFSDVERGDFARREPSAMPAMREPAPASARPPTTRQTSEERRVERDEKLNTLLDRSFTRDMEERLNVIAQSNKTDIRILDRVSRGLSGQKGEMTEGLTRKISAALRRTSTTEVLGRRMTLGEKFMHHWEDESGVPLTRKEQKIFDQIKHNIKDGERQDYENLYTFLSKRAGMSDADITNYIGSLPKNYMHHEWVGTFSEPTGIVDPLTGHSVNDYRRGMSTQPSSSRPKTLYAAIDEETGKRRIIGIRDEGVTAFDKNKKEYLAIKKKPSSAIDMLDRIKPATGKGRLPARVKLDGRWHTVDYARVREKEEQTVNVYQKNFAANTLINRIHMQRALRNARFLDWLSRTDQFKAHSSEIELPGYVKVNVPILDRYYIDKRIAEPINDFRGESTKIFGEPIQVFSDLLGGVNSLYTRTMFMVPFGHAINEVSMAALEKGISIANPIYWLHDIPKAMYQVATFGPDMRAAQRAGARMSMFKNTNDYMKRAYKAFGDYIETNPEEWSKWRSLMHAIGFPFRKANDFVNWWNYHISNPVLDFTRDTLMMARLYELQRHAPGMGKGLSLPDAIHTADQIMATYGVPSRTALPGVAGRGTSMFFKMNTPFIFQRWHYGVLRSLFNLAKGAMGGFGARGVYQAMSRMTAMAVGVFFVGPWLDQQWQQHTGLPGVKGALGGAMEVVREMVEELQKPYRERDLSRPFASMLQLSPLARIPAEEVFNQYLISHKPIREGGDLQRTMGTLEHLLQGTIQPLQTVEEWFAGKRNPIQQWFRMRSPPSPLRSEYINMDQNKAVRDWHKSPLDQWLSKTFGAQP